LKGRWETYQYQVTIFILGDKNPDKIVIENVIISIRPNVVITRPDRKLNTMVGRALLYFGSDSADYGDGIYEEKKSTTVQICLWAFTLIYMYVERNLVNLGTPDRCLSYSFDIFGGSAHQAPLSYVRRVNNICAACRVIAAQWAGISPPPNWPKSAM
jgi:hypothetical protein